jgi:transposase
VDPDAQRRGHLPGMRRLLSSTACGSYTRHAALEPPKTQPACPAARRGRHRSGAHGYLGSDHKRAEAQGQTILCIDEAGFYPLPRVVRTSAPVGQTPIIRECYTRAPLSAISASSPGGTLYFHSQDHPINSDDVVGFREHLLREVPGRMVLIWDGAPIHRSQVIRDFLADGAAQRLYLERLPAYAPELNPGEGLWPQLKGVELRHVCCFTRPHLRHELRDAVKRVRRRPRLITSFFQGAKL